MNGCTTTGRLHRRSAAFPTQGNKNKSKRNVHTWDPASALLTLLLVLSPPPAPWIRNVVISLATNIFVILVAGMRRYWAESRCRARRPRRM